MHYCMYGDIYWFQSQGVEGGQVQSCCLFDPRTFHPTCLMTLRLHFIGSGGLGGFFQLDVLSQVPFKLWIMDKGYQ